MKINPPSIATSKLPVLTATQAFITYVQACADIAECRDRYEKVGFVREWMTRHNAIACVLAILLKADYEHDISPHVMTSFLRNYSPVDLTDSFIEFYCHLMTRLNVSELQPESLRSDDRIDVLIDIPAFAKQGRVMGYKESWGVFKEPHLTDWKTQFQ